MLVRLFWQYFKFKKRNDMTDLDLFNLSLKNLGD